MPSIFSQTIAKAISTYRQMLRRYLPQAERVTRLNKLNLKDPHLYESDLALYRAAMSIVKDIEENMGVADQGYYSYSGIGTFCEYLKEYLSKYEIEGDTVIHRAQKASRALVQAIQLATLPENRLDENVKRKLRHCNEVIASFGSNEQHEIYINNLEKMLAYNEEFYSPILQNFKEQVVETSSPESA